MVALVLLAHIACSSVGFASGFVSSPAARDDRRSRGPFLSSTTTTDVPVSSSFWNDGERVARLPDPPSAERLKLIQEKPYRGGFEPAIDVEQPYELKIVQGRIPPDLIGTLASNGAGRIRVGDTQYGHWFDGDGYVSCVSFNGKENRAVFNGRYIRTSRFLAQEKLMKDMRRNHAEENDFSGCAGMLFEIAFVACPGVFEWVVDMSDGFSKGESVDCLGKRLGGFYDCLADRMGHSL